MENEAADHISREDRIHYALAKQVPAMRMNVEIHTSHGTLHFHYKDAQRIANLVQTLLERQLRHIRVANARAASRPR
jgi:hypothetical protein